MFDTHCHLNLDVFDNKYQNAIKDAKGKGVKYFLIPSTNLHDSKKAITISEEFGKAFVACGIHPGCHLKEEDLEKSIYNLEELVTLSDKVLAIGEIGLDYYKYKSAISVQKKYFIKQLLLAAKTEKSVIIHNRHAGEDIINILNKNWKNCFERSIVLHCCEADIHLLDFIKKRNLFIGVNGDLTYDQNKQDFIKKVPIEMLVIETDTPFLIPEPLKSKNIFPNEPKYLPLIIRHLAKIKNIDKEKLIELTTKNAKTLFGL